MKLEEIEIGNNLTGIEPTLIVSVIAVRSIAYGAVEVIYKTPNGTIRDCLLGRADEDALKDGLKTAANAYARSSGAFRENWLAAHESHLPVKDSSICPRTASGTELAVNALI